MEKKTISFDFNEELFNSVYWILDKLFSNTAIRYIWLYGGSSASKTYSVVQWQVIAMLHNSEENALVLRKISTDIKDSIYADFKNMISEWGLSSYFIIQTNFIKCTLTGSYVRFRGLDDAEKVKGISGFKKVIMEEVSQFDEVDFKQIKKRLRGKIGQQIIGIFNPISEDHWIKERVFDLETLIPQESDIAGVWLNDKGNIAILRTNYLDNKYIVGPYFVDQHVIDDFEKDKTTDYNYYQVYGLGNWGRIRTGGEFWKDFNTNIHCADLKWDEDKPIHLSWDENVNPYLTCLVWQFEGKNGKQIDEICLEDPRNRIKAVCQEFKTRYPVDRVKGLFIYGDRTSIKEDTKREKGENFFTLMMCELKEYHPSLRMQSVNPSIVQSAGFINQIYAGNVEGVSITIGNKCVKSKHDYQYALEDSDGTLKKTKKINSVTKVTYEEFGHPSDAKRYILTLYYANEYQKYRTGGKGIKVTVGKAESKHAY